MNRSLISLCIMIILSAYNILAQDSQPNLIKSDVNSVIVYLDGAEVTRKVNVSLKEGKNELAFEGLSPLLVGKSMRVKCPSDVSVLSLSSNIDYLYKKDLTPKMKVLSDSVKILDEKLTALNDRKDALLVEKDLLLGNRNFRSDEKGIVLTDLTAAADFFRKRIEEINKAVSEINRDAADINESQARITRQLRETQSIGNYERSNVFLLLESSKAMSAEIELKYLVTNAGWVPAYDIVAENLKETIDIVYRAKVYNQTQIDWKDVNVRLSTADPTAGATKPALDPWYLNYSYGYGYYGGENIYKKLEQVQIMDNEMQMAKGKVSSANLAQLSEYTGQQQQGTVIEVSELSAEFNIEMPYTINSDGKPYYLDVKHFQLPTTYKHFAIPKNDKYAFLISRITGWEDSDMVSGYASIYFNNVFVGRSFINTAELSDTLDISLGRDYKVLVERKQLKEFTKKQLIGSNRRDDYMFKMDVKNNRNYPITIEIIDQIPVSQDDEITVTKQETTAGEENLLTGELKWSYVMQPGDSKTINLSYSIKYPKNKPVRTKKYQYRNAAYLF